MSKTRYRWFQFKNVPGVIKERLFHKAKNVTSFRGQKGITIDYTDSLLCEYIKAGKPFAAIHFGGMEMNCLNGAEKIKLGLKKTFKDGTRYVMKNNAGFFPTDDANLSRFASIWLNECPSADILGIMGIHMEDYFVSTYLPNARIVQYEGMEPLHGHWSSLLKGKKVLIISPFEEEIKDQYAKREKLFPSNPDILPEFELKVIKSPLTLGDEVPEEQSSFEIYEAMKEKLSSTDFDIALVGCGALGSLLCCYIKSIGKQAILTGGSTQTLFGIMGKRWEKREHVSKYVNDAWIRPYAKAKGCAKIDQGAYW